MLDKPRDNSGAWVQLRGLGAGMAESASCTPKFQPANTLALSFASHAHRQWPYNSAPQALDCNSGIYGCRLAGLR